MSKIFDRTSQELGYVKRINEDVWFKQQQELLLWMANTIEGRALLCIDLGFPIIHSISKNSIKHVKKVHKDGKLDILADFRVGAKWANVIRYRWYEFQQLALQYYGLGFLRRPMFPVAVPQGAHYTTGTFYPDPDPETTTVDGHVYKNNSSSWATTRSATDGNFSTDTATEDSYPLVGKDGSNFIIGRAFHLYDTSSIGSGSTISSAVESHYYKATKYNSDNDGDDYLVIVSSNPASNTAIGTADFDTLGTTAYSNTIDIGSLTQDAYNDFTYNATGLAAISLTGVTKVGNREGHDVIDSAFAGADNTFNGMNNVFADTTGTSQDPKLVVNYTAASTAAANFLTLVGAGA